MEKEETVAQRVCAFRDYVTDTLQMVTREEFYVISGLKEDELQSPDCPITAGTLVSILERFPHADLRYFAYGEIRMFKSPHS